MKSVYARILLWCIATLVLSLFAFLQVSHFVEFRSTEKGGPLGRMDALLLKMASEAYESGGSSRAAACLDQTERYLHQRRYLTDASGRDLATGADHSDVLREVGSDFFRPHLWKGHMAVVLASPDNRYRLIAAVDPPVPLSSLMPYYFVIFAAVAVVFWALAFSIASPLRDLAHAVEQFGRGDLSVRLKSKRRDEVGELSRAFDEMAERIATLVDAERRLLQDVSHELRSPLARLSFAAELVRTAKNRDAAVARLQKEIQRLTGLVGTLIQVTRTEGDPSATNREPVALDELLREVASDCAVEAEARHCGIEVTADAKVLIEGDRELLRRAIENVVRNAIRYTPQGTRVDVRLQQPDHIAQITVRDYGLGVAPEYLDRIFEPFFRADDSRDSATGGVGLGLAIARRAIAVHHGMVKAENCEPGLQVSIELPWQNHHLNPNRSD